MAKENLPEESKPKPQGSEERKTAADDLKFMRFVVETMSQQVKPDVHIMIATGLIGMIANIAGYFLKTHQLDKWIWPMTMSMLSIILLYAIIGLVRIAKYEKKLVLSHT